ncbi:hypothetical protein [Halorussus halophilus]|uniref:hypothetical protein n=1 Tax=Halorussus halophilus TaxID=2650975 RepID=UPI0013011947|nr:hypothetical protein [Halorussus halophilus]
MLPADSFRTLFACLLVTSTFVGPVAADPDGELPNSVSDDHFVVKYADGYEASAQETLNMLQDIRTELQAETPVDTTIDEKIIVRIHPIDEWEDSRYSLHWHTAPKRINLIAPSDWETVEYVDEYYIKKNLAHEYANIMLYEYVERHGDRYHTRYPSWFGEGLSEYYAYHNVSEDIQRNYDPGVEKFEQKVEDGAGYFSVLTQDQYAGGHLLMHYVMNEYGEEAVFEMLSSTGEFEEVVQSELGVSYEVFKKRWLLWAETNIGGDYSVSADSVSKVDRIDSLERRLERKNGTIEQYQLRLEWKNETIADLRQQVDSLNGTDGQASENTNQTAQNQTTKLHRTRRVRTDLTEEPANPHPLTVPTHRWAAMDSSLVSLAVV